MPKHSDWRSAAAYDYVNDLDPAELAWEFLRRNPDYQREYRKVLRLGGEEALAEQWGLRFRDRPGEGGRPGGCVLAPHLDQSIVLLAHAPPGFSTAATLAGLTSPEQHVVASDGAYFVVRHETGRIIAVMVGGAAAANPLAALIPLNSSSPARSAAALRLWRMLSQGHLQRAPDPLTRQRRQRLRRALRALDGRFAKATYRELAQVLFSGPQDPDHWKTHELRDRTIRLVRTGFDLMRGGYRALLRISTRRK